MSEGMALEKLAEEHARLQGYLTLVRVPFKRPLEKGKRNRANTDFDVIGFNRKTGKVLLVEVKGYFAPEAYPDWSTDGWDRSRVPVFVDDLAQKWQEFVVSSGVNDMLGFRLKDLGEIRMVIPGEWPNDRKGFERRLESLVRKRLRRPVRVSILPIHDMLLEIIKLVKTDKDIRRVRYADTALEAFRWLLRRPQLHQEALTDILWSKKKEAK